MTEEQAGPGPDAAVVEAPPGPDGPGTGRGSGAAGPAPRGRGRRASDRYDPRSAVTTAIGVGAGLVLWQLAVAAAGRLRPLLVLLLLSLFLSFAMEPAVQWLHARGLRRGLGTGAVFLGVAAAGVGMVVALSGLVSEQVRNLVRAAPALLDQLSLRATQLPEPLAEPVAAFLADQSALLPDRLSDAAGTIGRSALGLSTTLLGAVFATLTVALLTFYLVADGPRLRWQLSRRLDPARQREFLRVWELAIAKTGGYVYSRVLLAVVSASVHAIAFSMLDLRYAIALGLWMGVVSSIVPVVGLYLAGALPVVVALADPDAATLGVLVVITVYQQLENYLVQPRITRHTLALHPAVSFVAVLAGAALLGPVGALLALPATAIVAALVTAYAEEHDVVEHGLTTTEQARVQTGRRTAR